MHQLQLLTLVVLSICLPSLAASPPLLPGFEITKDGTCGSGVTCLNSTWGQCCSKYGFCGSTTAYCETGCNPTFGTCEMPPAGGDQLANTKTNVTTTVTLMSTVVRTMISVSIMAVAASSTAAVTATETSRVVETTTITVIERLTSPVVETSTAHMTLLAALEYCTAPAAQPWVPTPVSVVFKLQNANSGKLMSIDKQSHANSAEIHQHDDAGTRDHLWQFVSVSGGWFKLKNMESGLLAGVQYMSKSNNAPLVQYEDNGTDDHLWRIESKGNGFFMLRNKNSGLVVGVNGKSRDGDANLIQYEDNGAREHLWSLIIVAYTK